MSQTQNPWGQSTRNFFNLTPDHILAAVEATGHLCTGRCLALNSMENRVYEVEIEPADPNARLSPWQKFLIIKFYRPGRWTIEQIQDEHDFLFDLRDADIPVVAPLKNEKGDSVFRDKNLDLLYALFPKIGGRSPDELEELQCERVGRLLARMHNVGAIRTSKQRIHLSPATYGISNLRWLCDSGLISNECIDRYKVAVEKICSISEGWFAKCKPIRIHGDCHLGNLIWGQEGPFWVDFDDMVMGPEVQDLWLMLPGRDSSAQQLLKKLVTSYELMRPFDRSSLRLIEVLRALRFVHFSAWIGKRWSDPSFPKAFPQFATPRWWAEQTRDLEEQLRLIQEPLTI